MIVYFSTKSKQTRKQKQKQKDEWEQYKQKYGLVEKKDTSFHPKSLLKIHRDVLRPGAESFRNLPSVDSGLGSTARPADKVYTGDKMIGVAAMHKSNLVPIFNDEAAKDVATMRRG